MKQYSTIQKVNDSEFIVTDYEKIYKQKTITIKYSTIFIVILLLIASVCVSFYLKNRYGNVASDETAVCSDICYPFSDDGFVFPLSNSQYLTSEDIDMLKAKATESEYTYQELLRFSINEIYARHGFLFLGGKFEKFYCQYQWYLDLEKVETVNWSKFNVYEQKNIALLVDEEKRNGFR